MPKRLGSLIIDGVIFHSIPTKAKAGATTGVPFATSDQESRLLPELANLLKERLVGTFRKSEHPVEQNKGVDTPVYDAIALALQSGLPSAEGFAELTKRWAEALYNIQPPGVPAGVLAVLRGQTQGKPIIAFMKLEQESGLVFETVEENGIKTIQAAVQPDVSLAEGARSVFKAAYFTLPEGRNRETPLAKVSDEQSSRGYFNPGAKYWPTNFLGCVYANSAKVQTTAFAEATKDFLNNDVRDAGEKDRLLNALTAELHNERTDIEPSVWMERYVPEGYRDLYRQRLLVSCPSNTPTNS